MPGLRSLGGQTSFAARSSAALNPSPGPARAVFLTGPATLLSTGYNARPGVAGFFRLQTLPT